MTDLYSCKHGTSLLGHCQPCEEEFRAAVSDRAWEVGQLQQRYDSYRAEAEAQLANCREGHEQISRENEILKLLIKDGDREWFGALDEALKNFAEWDEDWRNIGFPGCDCRGCKLWRDFHDGLESG